MLGIPAFENRVLFSNEVNSANSEVQPLEGHVHKIHDRKVHTIKICLLNLFEVVTLVQET